MSKRAEILFLAHRIPYPPDKGDKIRSWRLLQSLAKRFDVHLAAFVDDPDDLAHEGVLRGICASVALIGLDPKLARLRSAAGFLRNRALSLAYYRDQRMRRAVDVLRAKPLAVEIVFSSTMAQYVEAPVAGRPRIVDFCDADSEKFSAYAADATLPMSAIYHREGRLLAEAESDIANWADASFAITQEEAERFNRRKEISRTVDWFSNGVDGDYWNPHANFSPLEETVEIVFTGAMDYAPNVEAALFFSSNVWPLVRKAMPSARFAIVGARPVHSLRRLDGKNGVTVTGRVDDIRPWLAGAKLAVAPLQVARGVQNKVLEAMAMARPVVATLGAATGIAHAPGKDLIVADDAAGFAAEVTDLLHSDRRRNDIGEAARARVVADYQWPAQLARFERRVNQVLGSDSLSVSSVA